jgi:hypothetical protein
MFGSDEANHQMLGSDESNQQKFGSDEANQQMFGSGEANQQMSTVVLTAPKTALKTIYVTFSSIRKESVDVGCSRVEPSKPYKP